MVHADKNGIAPIELNETDMIDIPIGDGTTKGWKITMEGENDTRENVVGGWHTYVISNPNQIVSLGLHIEGFHHISMTDYYPISPDLKTWRVWFYAESAATLYVYAIFINPN